MVADVAIVRYYDVWGGGGHFLFHMASLLVNNFYQGKRAKEDNKRAKEEKHTSYYQGLETLRALLTAIVVVVAAAAVVVERW